jgi:hypothetical protein
MIKTCPRCHQPFDCRADNIEACACSKLTLSATERTHIGAYTEQLGAGYVCLCVACLTKERVGAAGVELEENEQQHRK